MKAIIFTDPTNTQGRIVHDYTDTGVPQETYGPIPPNAGDVREVYERLLADGVTPTPWTPPAPAIAQVIAERDRRLALGFDFDFGDARGVHRIGTTEGDMRGWDEVTKIALARHAVGTTTTILIVTDTGPVEVTPAEWLAILEAANTFRQPIWHASFAIQALDPIPADYAADTRWP